MNTAFVNVTCIFWGPNENTANNFFKYGLQGRYIYCITANYNVLTLAQGRLE